MADYPLTEVWWRDAYFDFDQKGRKPKRKDYIVRTIGFLVYEDKHFIHLAREILPGGDGFRAVTHIPIDIVDERRVIVDD